MPVFGKFGHSLLFRSELPPRVLVPILMTPLPNYLLSNRKRLALSQEEVGFLLGIKGEAKGAKVCRDEKFVREPSLQTALAYGVIFQKPTHELFAGLYQQIEEEVAARAKILTYRKARPANQQSAHKRKMLLNLAARKSLNESAA